MPRGWITGIGMFVSMGAILLSIAMCSIIGDESNPWAIFWFFVAAGATGVLYLCIKSDEREVYAIAATMQPNYWIVYHGTPTWTNAAGAMREGFTPGKDGTYGIAVYTAFDFALAAYYARDGGYVFRLYIDRNTPFVDYDQVPGNNAEEKRTVCLQNNWNLVFVKRFQMFVIYGYTGVPTSIPGLKQVEVLDKRGNPVTIN